MAVRCSSRAWKSGTAYTIFSSVPHASVPHAEFLVDRSWRSTRLAVALHWTLLIDCEDAALVPRIAAMQSRLFSQLQRHNPSGHDAITGQMRLKALLDRFGKEARPHSSHACLPNPCNHRARQHAR